MQRQLDSQLDSQFETHKEDSKVSHVPEVTTSSVTYIASILPTYYVSSASYPDYPPPTYAEHERTHNTNRVTKIDREYQLQLGVKENDITTIKKILNEEVNQQIKNADGDTCLHIAAKMGHVDAMQLLLDHWFDIEVKDNQGNTCLHVAVIEKQVAMVKLLLKEGMDPSITNEDGKTSLDLAIMDHHGELIEILYEANNKVGATLIHEAVKNKNLDALKNELRRTKHLINQRGASSNTPLHIAVTKPFVEGVKYLIDQGAYLNLSSRQKEIDEMTAFCIALKVKNTELALLLLEKGAQFHRTFGSKKRHPIHLAAEFNQLEVIKKIIQLRPALLDVKDQDQHSALYYAMKNHHFTIIDFLLDSGASLEDAKKFTENDETLLLHLMKKYGIKKITQNVRLLIQNTIKQGCLLLLEFLLEQMPEHLEKKIKQRTPLCFALENPTKHQYQIVKLLLGKGANIYEKTPEGKELINIPVTDEATKTLLQHADLFYKFRNPEMHKKVYGEVALVVNYIKSTLTGHVQRKAIKDALDPNHNLNKMLYLHWMNIFSAPINNEITRRLELALKNNREKKLKRLTEDYPVIFKARENDLTLKTIIEKERGLLDKPDHEGRTPLRIAASHGYFDLVCWFLAQGANPTLTVLQEGRFERKKNMADRAEQKGYPTISNLLKIASLYWNLVHKEINSDRKLGTSEKAELFRYIDDIYQDEKNQQIKCDILNPQTQIGKFFYPLDQTTISYFYYPFVFAAEQGDIATLNKLYAQNPQLIFFADNRGWMPLQAAINFNQTHAINWLIQHGASKDNIQSLEVQLKYAIANENYLAVKDCLERGANPNIMTSDGALPLNSAIFLRQEEIVNLLLQFNADPTLPENRWSGVSAEQLSTILAAKSTAVIYQAPPPVLLPVYEKTRYSSNTNHFFNTQACKQTNVTTHSNSMVAKSKEEVLSSCMPPAQLVYK